MNNDMYNLDARQLIKKSFCRYLIWCSSLVGSHLSVPISNKYGINMLPKNSQLYDND
jgi:hypothetical protein